MPVTSETFVQEQQDGDGLLRNPATGEERVVHRFYWEPLLAEGWEVIRNGTYGVYITADVDRSPQGTVRDWTVRAVSIDARQRIYPVNYTVRRNSNNQVVASGTVPAGEQVSQTGLSFRVDIVNGEPSYGIALS